MSSYPNFNSVHAIFFCVGVIGYLVTGCQTPEPKHPHKREKQAPKEEAITFPKHYQHHKYLEQINTYRRTYDRINAKTVNFSEDHIDGLFPILKNGFALVHAYIVQDNKRHSRNVHLTLHNLNELFKVALKVDKDKKLSQHAFISLHLFLAALLDRYKGLPDQKIAHAYNASSLHRLLTSKEPDVLLKGHAKKAIPHETNQLHVAILYKDKTTSGIQPRAFVEELLHEQYPLAIAIFDVGAIPDSHRQDDSERIARNKHHVHESKVNGTTNLLLHDLSDIQKQSKMEALLLKHHGIDWHQQLKKIDMIRDRLKKNDPNSYRVLTNGLFVLTHELFQVSPQGYDTIISGKYLPKKAKFAHILSFVIKTMTMPGHMVTQKDHEFILRGIKDQHQSRLLPNKEKWDSLSDQQKIPLLQKAYNTFWKLFIEIIKNHYKTSA